MSRIMKRRLAVLLSFAAAAVLGMAGCASGSEGSGSFGGLSKAGISPYECSDSEKGLLEAFGISSGNSQILSFQAPEESVSLTVTVSRLEEGGTWKEIGGGTISSGDDLSGRKPLSGMLTMKLEEDRRIDFHIRTSSLSSFRTDPVLPEPENLGSMTAFLQEFTEIEQNKEIPAAILTYDSGSAMRSCSLQDYFDPSVFEGTDLVLAVTVRFSDTDA